LTVEWVSAALGTQVQDEGACTFYATDDAGIADVAFNGQDQGTCDRPSEAGYDEALDGLGVDAYV
jgi:hypothetical protein